MLRKEKHTIECPCERQKQFPIVLQYEEGKLKGSTTQEIECLYCQKLLAIELPGTVQQGETIIRGLKI